MADRTILLPLDGSRTALRAVPYAAALAKMGESVGVVLFMALPTRDEADIPVEQPTRDEWESIAQRRLRPSARRLRALGVKRVEIDTRWGMQDADEILAAAERHGASLIVMGTHGRGGLTRALLGSTAMSVLQHSPMPAVFVPPGAPIREVQIERALLPIDGSELSSQAIPQAQALAAAGVEVTLLRVVPPSSAMAPFAMPGVEGYVPVTLIEDLTAAAEENVRDVMAQFPSGKVKGEVMIGAPAQSIIDYATAHDIDLIVMTTHARSGLRRVILGSVTDRVMRTARVPVLVVRPVEKAKR